MRNLIIMLWTQPAACRKFIVALIGAVGVAVSQGLLPAAIGGWLPVVIAFVTALGVYGIYNDKTPSDNSGEKG